MLNSFGEMCFLEETYKNSNFEIFESAFYMKSGSMPLICYGAFMADFL